MDPHVVALTRRVALVVLLVAGAGCYRPSEESPAPANEATLIVDNQAFLDHTVYIVRGGQGGAQFRLGIARGSARSTFSIGPRILGLGGDFAFQADPIGGQRTPVSERIHIAPGEVVEVVILP